MNYRKLDSNGDYTFGQGPSTGFFTNVPDAVAQAVLTRLRLWQGEWFLDKTEGTPYLQSILGATHGHDADAAIRARVLGTPGVTAILAYNSARNGQTRALQVTMTIDTVYGQAALGATL